LQRLTDFHVGDIVTHLTKVSLLPGAREVLLYTSLHGAIGIFVPFSTRDDIEFFSLLETQLRQAAPSILGRDHMSYRGYYNPVKTVVDGDLCEQYLLLVPGKRREIAEEMERNAGEIVKKLEDIRNRVAF
jgi:splicing factor 3B subunit 3